MTKELEEAFADWWNSDYLLPDNPYKKDSKAYWAWEGYAAGVKAERDACAKLCDDQGQGKIALEHYAALTYASATHDCATIIRARRQS